MKLYAMNSLFEFELSAYPKPFQPSLSMLSRNEVMQYLFLAISNPTDYTIMDTLSNPDLQEIWKEVGLQFGKVVRSTELPTDAGLIEWGNTSIVNKGILQKDTNRIQTSQHLNSKKNQAQWKNDSKLNTIHTHNVQTKEELIEKFTMLNLIVIRTEFGFSGIGSTIVRSQEELLKFLAREKFTKPLLVEEWVGEQKQTDFSALFDVKQGLVSYLCSTKMVIDVKRQYIGSTLLSDDSMIPKEPYLQILKTLLKGSSYEGPVSIDGFSYQKGENLQYQFISEFNFRYTMGRVLLELSQKLKPKKVNLMKVPEEILEQYSIAKIRELSSLLYNKFQLKNIPLTPLHPKFTWVLIEQ
jgi:hypothetical protein